MKKIPTLYVRDHSWRLTSQVRPDCAWVINGEGTATRKFDGVCVRIAPNGTHWTRREIRFGQKTPEDFLTEDVDNETGKIIGWEAASRSPFWRYYQEALKPTVGQRDAPGTYELCGPKINGNLQKFDKHVLIRHVFAERFTDLDHPNMFGDSADDVFDWLKKMILQLPPEWEGIVWHHKDGRMAKIKKKDFK